MQDLVCKKTRVGQLPRRLTWCLVLVCLAPLACRHQNKPPAIDPAAEAARAQAERRAFQDQLLAGGAGLLPATELPAWPPESARLTVVDRPKLEAPPLPGPAVPAVPTKRSTEVAPEANLGPPPTPPAPVEVNVVNAAHLRPLVKAMMAFFEQRPDEAVQLLQAYDPKDQEIILHMLPLLAQIDQKGGLLAAGNDAEVVRWLDTLRELEYGLRVKAPLVLQRLTFCRSIEAFGQVTKAPATPFRPGEAVQLYAEVVNLADQRTTEGTYAVRLECQLVLRFNDGRPAAPPQVITSDRNDSSSPRQDHFVRIGYHLPRNLLPGLYSLSVEIKDLDSGRVAQQSIGLEVKAPGSGRSSF